MEVRQPEIDALELKTLDVRGQSEWRVWLKEHRTTDRGVWLVFRKGASKSRSISYDEALDEALAFGWIDSVLRRVDDERYVRKFTPRRPWSIWSRLNIVRVERLRRERRMTKWGEEAFEKRTSEVSQLVKVNTEGAKVPEDLEGALARNEQAWSNFLRMAPSHRKRYLIWISSAKKPETRAKRIAEAVNLISRNVKTLLK